MSSAAGITNKERQLHELAACLAAAASMLTLLGPVFTGPDFQAACETTHRLPALPFLAGHGH